MPNPVYAYILDIYMVCKQVLLITFLNEPEIICLRTVKWFQVLLYNTNNLTSVVCLQTEFVLLDSKIGAYQGLPLRIRVD